MSVSVFGTNPLSLPLEIWSQIFSFLSLEDRKSARLTCRRFQDACCTLQIQRKEEMVFDGCSNTLEAIRLLCDRERKIWNIKLRAVYLDDSVISFFEKHGSDIYSLILIDCTLAERILRDILGACINLHNFAVIFTIDNSSRYNPREAVYPEFEALLKRGVLCSTVTNLTLELISWSSCRLTNKQLVQIFAIFPNVKKLNLTITFPDQVVDNAFQEYLSDSTSDPLFSPDCIYDYLERLRHQLEELSVNIWQRWSASFTAYETLAKISSIEMKNLRKLSTNYNYLCRMETLPNFQLLTSLTCVIAPHPTMTLSDKVLLILKSATKLDSLTLKVDVDYLFVVTSQKCFIAFVKSQLKTLNIWRSSDFSFCPDASVVSTYIKPSSLDPSLLPNYCLNHLRLQTDNPNLMFLFSKYFLCLENIIVKHAEEQILYNIFNYQRKLRSLELYHCERYPLSRMRPKDNPFERRLRNLEISYPSQLDNLIHLCLVDNISLDLSRFMLSKFVFSKLKSLTIRMYDVYGTMECDIEALWQTIQKSTQLEHLEIGWRTMATFPQWLKLIESLPKLRHFTCADSCPTLFDDSEYRQLFRIRPSLRSVKHSLRKKFKFIRYIKDIITNEINWNNTS